MKPSELIKELEQFVNEENPDEELDVEFAYDYGDHYHNIVTESISTVEQSTVVYSDYHQKNCIVDDDEEKEETIQVIVLQ